MAGFAIASSPSPPPPPPPTTTLSISWSTCQQVLAPDTLSKALLNGCPYFHVAGGLYFILNLGDASLSKCQIHLFLISKIQ